MEAGEGMLDTHLQLHEQLISTAVSQDIGRCLERRVRTIPLRLEISVFHVFPLPLERKALAVLSASRRKLVHAPFRRSFRPVGLDLTLHRLSMTNPKCDPRWNLSSVCHTFWLFHTAEPELCSVTLSDSVFSARQRVSNRVIP